MYMEGSVVGLGTLCRTLPASESTTLARTYIRASCGCANIASGSTMCIRTGPINHHTHAPTPTRTCAHACTLLTDNSASLASATLTSREHSLHPHELSASER